MGFVGAHGGADLYCGRHGLDATQSDTRLRVGPHTLPRIVTPYRDSLDGTRDRVTYQKSVTR